MCKGFFGIFRLIPCVSVCLNHPSRYIVIQHWVVVGIFLFLKVKSQSRVLVKNGYQVSQLNKKTCLWWYSRSYKEGPSPSLNWENRNEETFSMGFDGLPGEYRDCGRFANVCSIRGFSGKKKAVSRTAEFQLVAGDGIEPSTFRLWAWQATTALPRNKSSRSANMPLLYHSFDSLSSPERDFSKRNLPSSGTHSGSFVRYTPGTTPNCDSNAR